MVGEVAKIASTVGKGAVKGAEVVGKATVKGVTKGAELTAKHGPKIVKGVVKGSTKVVGGVAKGVSEGLSEGLSEGSDMNDSQQSTLTINTSRDKTSTTRVKLNESPTKKVNGFSTGIKSSEESTKQNKQQEITRASSSDKTERMNIFKRRTKFPSGHEIEEVIMCGTYSDAYDNDKLFNKFNDVDSKVYNKILYPVFVLYELLTDDNVPRKDKFIIISALGYFISPVDLYPDFLIGGFADDVLGILCALKTCEKHTTDDIRNRAKERLVRFQGGK